METKLIKIIQDMKNANKIANEILSESTGWLSDATRVRYIHHIESRIEIIKQLESIL